MKFINCVTLSCLPALFVPVMLQYIFHTITQSNGKWTAFISHFSFPPATTQCYTKHFTVNASHSHTNGKSLPCKASASSSEAVGGGSVSFSWAAWSIVVKLLDLDPQGRWFDSRCSHYVICTAVGPLSKATLLQGGLSHA